MSTRQEKENGMPVARIARRYVISRQSVYNVVNGVSGATRERGSAVPLFGDGRRPLATFIGPRFVSAGDASPPLD